MNFSLTLLEYQAAKQVYAAANTVYTQANAEYTAYLQTLQGSDPLTPDEVNEAQRLKSIADRQMLEATAANQYLQGLSTSILTALTPMPRKKVAFGNNAAYNVWLNGSNELVSDF